MLKSEEEKKTDRGVVEQRYHRVDKSATATWSSSFTNWLWIRFPQAVHSVSSCLEMLFFDIAAGSPIPFPHLYREYIPPQKNKMSEARGAEVDAVSESVRRIQDAVRKSKKDHWQKATMFENIPVSVWESSFPSVRESLSSFSSACNLLVGLPGSSACPSLQDAPSQMLENVRSAL